MAIHENLGSLAESVIDEYLKAADLCLYSGGECLGCPAALLVFCATNALGTYLQGEAVNIDGKQVRITSGEPFRVFNYPLFGLDLSGTEIRRLARSFRHRLSHNAIIDPDSILIARPRAEPFVFDSKSVSISVPDFYGMVCKAWEDFPRSKIGPRAEELTASRPADHAKGV